MHSPLSLRGLVIFFGLEFALVAVVAVLGQAWWLFVGLSGLCFASVWGYDHPDRLKAVRRRCRVETQTIMIVGLVGMMLFTGITLTAVIMQGKTKHYAVIAPDPPVAREGYPIAWSKVIGMGGRTDDKGNQLVNEIGITGINEGKEEVELVGAHIISGLTGQRLDLKIHAGPAGPVSPDRLNPIPPKAHIHTSTEKLNPPTGMLEKDFLRDWGMFSLIVEYDGKKHRINYSREQVLAIFPDRSNTLREPQVTAKPQ